MSDEPQTMPDNEALAKREFTLKEWLMYYKNMWVRNLAARLIDVRTDTVEKELNPEEQVQEPDGRVVPVKVRLEMRKMSVQDALNIIAGADYLLAIPDADFDAKTTSKEALAVSPEMVPPKEGDNCKTADNENGTYQFVSKEKLVCIPAGKSVEDYLKEKAEKEHGVGVKKESDEEGGSAVPAAKK